MRFKAGQQNFKFGNNNTAFLQRNVAYKKNHVNGVGVSSSGTLSKYNYSLWFSNSNAGFDINKDFKTKSGLSGVVGLSAMDGLKTRSVYASAKYGKFVLSASTLFATWLSQNVAPYLSCINFSIASSTSLSLWSKSGSASAFLVGGSSSTNQHND
jgi:hypothetical protein